MTFRVHQVGVDRHALRTCGCTLPDSGLFVDNGCRQKCQEEKELLGLQEVNKCVTDVDGLFKIRQTHQLRLEVELPLFTTGFCTIPGGWEWDF